MGNQNMDREQQKFLRSYMNERFGFNKWNSFSKRARRECPPAPSVKAAARVLRSLNAKVNAHAKRVSRRQESLKERFGKLHSEAQHAILFGTERDVRKVFKKMEKFGPRD